MEKKTPPKNVLGRDIFLLFLTYPLKILPVVEKKKIIAFLNKSKTFSMKNIDYFLEKPIEKESLLKLCSPQEEESFLAQLEKKQIQQIPLVILKDKKITIFQLSQKEFLFHFNPIKKLLKDHFEMLFCSLPIPFIVYNCFLSPLYLNEAAKELLKKIDFLDEKIEGKSHNKQTFLRVSPRKSLFGESNEWTKLAEKIGEIFISPLNNFEKKKKKKIYQHSANKKNLKITAEKIIMEKKIVWVLYFAEIAEKNA